MGLCFAAMHLLKLPAIAFVCLTPTVALAQSTRPTTEPSATTQADTAEATAEALELEGFVAPRDAFEAKFEPKAYGGDLKVIDVVSHGATVKGGTPLIRFDTTEIDDDILGAAADSEAAKAAVLKAEADVALGDRSDAAALEKNSDALADAQRDLDYMIKRGGPNFLKQLELQEKSSLAQIEDQNDELDQLRKMYASESLTNATADIVVKRAVRTLEQSKATYELAKDELEKQRQTTYVDNQQEAERAVEAAKQSLDAFQVKVAQDRVERATALTKARIAARAAQRKLSELEQDKTAMTIVAPHDGIAYFGEFTSAGSWSNTEPDTIQAGKKQSPSTTLLTLVKPGQVRVIARANDDQLARLKVGESTRLDIAAVGGEDIEGKVSSVSPLPSADGSFEVVIDLVAADALLVPGMKAKIRVEP